MPRLGHRFVLGLAAMVALLTIAASAQDARRAPAIAAKSGDKRPRRRTSPPRRRNRSASPRIACSGSTPAMARLVDDKQVAGLVTLLERHGKVVEFNAVGRQDVRKRGCRCRRTPSSASIR